MKLLCNYFIGIISLLVTSIASVYGQPTGCNTVVYFGNGINSTKIGALHSKNILKRRLRDTLSSEEFDRLTFKIALNNTGGAFTDILETEAQGVGASVSSFYRMIARIDTLPDWFQRASERVAIRMDKTFLSNIQDLKTHVDEYELDILNGNNVLVVAHSQGNFFANQSYNLVNNNLLDKFKIVSVGSPDKSVGGNGLYTTLHEDIVIQGIRLFRIATRMLDRLPLLSNVTNNFTLDPTGHKFFKSYMAAGTSSNNKILGDIQSTLVSFPDCVTTSSIKITKAKCVRVDAGTSSERHRWTLEGFATSNLSNVFITAVPDGVRQFSDDNLYSCTRWNGIFKYGFFGQTLDIPSQNHCGRIQRSDPQSTRWESVKDANPNTLTGFVADLSTTTNPDGINTSNISLIVREQIPTDFTCPGTYYFQ